MVGTIDVEIFLQLINPHKGSDIYRVNEILQEKIIDAGDDALWKREQPGDYALHILSSFMTKLYKDQRNPLPQALNRTLKDLAHDYWEKRQRFGIEGNEMNDWEHAAQSFAQACFNYASRPLISHQVA